eukprot:CAMPEP_0185759914 /NCGR_PEP_ID=MMETSP1174-20130828/18727_1 /TAXON_ID=35687 /ORGANISM="Dictyocha speculum, Strain CCMP1381" /LENGTH=254 /DNA_ID=CAMNT_0028440487 /DNA_START=182 /DNA_END=946 /DNA_ORIENTATION=-
MNVFHFCRRRFGTLHACAIGSILHGLGVAMVGYMPRLGYIWVCLTCAALGNGICRPAYTYYLSTIANKSHVTQTLALIDVTLNAAMVIGAQLTQVFAYYGDSAAFTLAGTAAFFQALITLILYLTEKRQKKTSGDQELRAAIPKDEFIKEISESLVMILEKRNYDLEQRAAQQVLRGILDQAFPFLRPGGPDNREHMEDVYMLLTSLGRDADASDIQYRFGFDPVDSYLQHRPLSTLNTRSRATGRNMLLDSLT